MGDCGKRTLLVLVCILVLGSKFVHLEEFPPAEDIWPCTRDDGIPIIVRCSDLESNFQLRAIIEKIKDHEITLILSNSNLGDVPGNIFKGAHIVSIQLSNNKNITSLGDKVNPPFTGLEHSLTSLEILGEKLLKGPLQLGHLKKLTELYLYGMDIPTLGNDWFSDGPESMEKMQFYLCGIKQVGDKAFARLENLKFLVFMYNFATLQRSALPERALHLKDLSVRHNGIKELPSDFFEQLPALKEFDAAGNFLTSMPQDTWEFILSQLSLIDLTDNPFVCDFKLKWTIYNKNKANIDGSCTTLETKREVYIPRLTMGDLYEAGTE